ncbi:hypothetical protein chiPu_0008343 [Chiloscyllium punctatum]|uniref:Uncharacterized protein n=2 Tax=Chiloscyllium punctatum TaxID=137246 RepID=A0A401SHS5_CHIPU|nr:hypothetical protein [Chiloscyllium punctatum]
MARGGGGCVELGGGLAAGFCPRVSRSLSSLLLPALLALLPLPAAAPAPAAAHEAGDFSILDEAQVLANQMRVLATSELGVFNMQTIYNSFVYTEKISNGETEVQQLAKKIREKFNRYLDVVNRNKQVVEASYTAHLTSPLTAIQDCCTIPASMME